MQQTLRQLESAMTDISPEQRKLLGELNAQIEENGRHYIVESLTVEQMREHGYDVTEQDAASSTVLPKRSRWMPTCSGTAWLYGPEITELKN